MLKKQKWRIAHEKTRFFFLLLPYPLLAHFLHCFSWTKYFLRNVVRSEAHSSFFQAEEEKRGARITQGKPFLKRGSSNKSSGSFRRRSIRLTKNESQRRALMSAGKKTGDPDAECKHYKLDFYRLEFQYLSRFWLKEINYPHLSGQFLRELHNPLTYPND